MTESITLETLTSANRLYELLYQYWGITVAVTIVSLVFSYVRKNVTYWKSRGVDGPMWVPVMGMFAELFKRSWASVEWDWYKKYGRIYGRFLANQPSLVVGEPELVKRILVKDFQLFHNRMESLQPEFKGMMFFARDETWKRLRAITSPTFTSGKIKKMFDMIRVCLTEYIDHLEQFAKVKQEIDAKEVNNAFTMDVIARCAFGTKSNTHKDKNNKFVTSGYDMLNPPALLLLIIFLPEYLYHFVKNIFYSKEKLPETFFHKVVDYVVQKRQQEQQKESNFIQLLMNACEDKQSDSSDDSDVEEKDAHNNNNNKDIKLSSDVKRTLSKQEIVDQSVLFLIAGFETTSTTITYCLYEMAVNQDIQDEAYREVLEATGGTDGKIEYDELMKLPYLGAVISETLRKYPPVLGLVRQAYEDCRLGKVDLKKDAIVEIPVLGMHHDPEFFPEPEVFKPERFLDENKKNIIDYTYLPFGTGPRNCVGMRFAYTEIRLAMAHLLLKYKFFKTANTDIPLRYKKMNLNPLLQAERVKIGIELRN